MIARIPLPRVLMEAVLCWYCEKFHVKTAEIPDGVRFKNLDAFFTRELRKGVHVIDRGKNTLVSPVDARIAQYGRITDDTLLQAKGMEYRLGEFLPSEYHRNFLDGSFITLYLAPGDYHRIHSPVKGRIAGYYAIPGKLYTVQEFMVCGLKGLFSLNERVFSYIDADCGPVAVCKVGAMNVGRITLSYCDAETNRMFRRRHEHFYPEHKGPRVEKGGELGVFHMGSTVVVLFRKNAVRLDTLAPGTPIRMGMRIGRF
jgi:phosphatidylserine decarboxylase